MNTVARKTLSIMMVIGLVVGGLPLFFAATDNAEAAVGVWEKRTSAMSVMHSNGKLTVDVSTFEDEGNKPIQGYTLLLKWDQCRKDLNPLSGFWRTIRSPQTATITTDAKGEAEYKFSLGNGVWTENLWIYGSSEGWQIIEYFLGNIASTNIHLDIQTQASMATQHAIQRADTLGLIHDWYELAPAALSPSEGGAPIKHIDVWASQQYVGATQITMNWLMETNGHQSNVVTAVPGTSSAGSIKYSNIKNYYVDELNLLPAAKGGKTQYYAFEDWMCYGEVWFSVYKPSTGVTDMRNYRTTLYADDGKNNITVCVLEPHAPQTKIPMVKYDLAPGMYNFIVKIENLYTGETYAASAYISLYTGSSADLVLGDLDELDVLPTIDVWSDTSTAVTINLNGRWGEWQTSGYSTTITDQDLVPVAAHIRGIYPLVISNPRWDKTPIAENLNGFKFDVYNIHPEQTIETVNLALTTDNGTQVWATTVGSQAYPTWTDASQFTTVHLTHISMPAEPRKLYTLIISCGGAVTEIPVVFYPAEMDPDVIYEPKKDLDEIIKDYGTVNAAALKAYHDWAVSMQPRIKVIKADVQNYTKLFEQRLAVDNLALSDAAATRGLELITALKEICKGDGSDTSIGELTSHAQGIWSSYQAALLYRETAISYEAGQTAFGNSTALDAWYQDLVSKRITVGLQEQKQGDDPNSVAVWVGVAVALVVGGLVMYLCWKYIIPPLKRVMPKGRSPRLRTIRAVTPVVVTIVLAVIIALVAFLATWNIALSIEAALR